MDLENNEEVVNFIKDKKKNCDAKKDVSKADTIFVGFEFRKCPLTVF